MSNWIADELDACENEFVYRLYEKIVIDNDSDIIESFNRLDESTKELVTGMFYDQLKPEEQQKLSDVISL